MKRTMITQTVLETIAKQLDSQDEKGIKKYGKSLDHVPVDSYDWNIMALEELADCIKYVTMENVRLKRELLVINNDIENEVRKRVRDKLNKIYDKMLGGDVI